jgi:hypothetical protein
VRTVAVVVDWIIVIVGKIPAERVVNVAVVIVINPVARDLARVDPDVGGEIGVVLIDARVKHGGDDVLASRESGQPGFNRVNVRPLRAAGLTAVIETP